MPRNTVAPLTVCDSHNLPHQGPVNRRAVMVGGFGGVDHQLLAQLTAVGVDGGQRRWPSQQLAVAFAHPHPFHG